MIRHRLGATSSSSLSHSNHQQTQILDASIEQLREKLQPLNTQRLKTLRQATKSFIVS